MSAYEKGIAAGKREDTWIFSCPFCAAKQPQEYADWVRGFREQRAKQESR